MNRLVLVGRIVREIELKEVGADGRVVVNNVIAVPKTYQKDNESSADFIAFVAWGKRAELIEKYCQKGDLIGLDGRIQSRQYTNASGETQYITEMIVENIQFLPNSKKD